MSCSVLPFLSGTSGPSATFSLLGHCLPPSCAPLLPSFLSLQFSSPPTQDTFASLYGALLLRINSSSPFSEDFFLSLYTAETCVFPGYCLCNFLQETLPKAPRVRGARRGGSSISLQIMLISHPLALSILLLLFKKCS